MTNYNRATHFFFILMKVWNRKTNKQKNWKRKVIEAKKQYFFWALFLLMFTHRIPFSSLFDFRQWWNTKTSTEKLNYQYAIISYIVYQKHLFILLKRKNCVQTGTLNVCLQKKFRITILFQRVMFFNVIPWGPMDARLRLVGNENDS